VRQHARWRTGVIYQQMALSAGIRIGVYEVTAQRSAARARPSHSDGMLDLVGRQ